MQQLHWTTRIASPMHGVRSASCVRLETSTGIALQSSVVSSCVCTHLCFLMCSGDLEDPNILLLFTSKQVLLHRIYLPRDGWTDGKYH